MNIGSCARFAKGGVSYVLYDVYAGFVRKSARSDRTVSIMDALRGSGPVFTHIQHKTIPAIPPPDHMPRLVDLGVIAGPIPELIV